jgi:hypothetical protein
VLGIALDYNAGSSKIGGKFETLDRRPDPLNLRRPLGPKLGCTLGPALGDKPGRIGMALSRGTGAVLGKSPARYH